MNLTRYKFLFLVMTTIVSGMQVEVSEEEENVLEKVDPIEVNVLDSASFEMSAIGASSVDLRLDKISGQKRLQLVARYIAGQRSHHVEVWKDGLLRRLFLVSCLQGFYHQDLCRLRPPLLLSNLPSINSPGKTSRSSGEW